jgi:hypothetical protein
MLRDRELDAIIVGNDVPNDPAFKTVFPDSGASAAVFWNKHKFIPVNHMVTIRRELAQSRPDVVHELMRLFRAAKAAAPISGGHDPLVMGRSALEGPIRLALRYTREQGLLPHDMDIADVWEGLPASLAQELA